jgi:hypothetical protein
MTKKLVLVDCISQHLVRYVVEVEDNIDYALDTVVLEQSNVEFPEFSQKHLGETIVSHREISKEEYLKLFDQDNDYLSSLSDDRKLKFINVPKI